MRLFSCLCALCFSAEPTPCDNATQFTCANSRCVEKAWTCDGDNDCLDMSDEVDCDDSVVSGGHCLSYEFTCTLIHECVHKAWVCDGDFDCQDHSDENLAHCKCVSVLVYSRFLLCTLRVCLTSTRQHLRCYDGLEEEEH